MKLIYLNYFVFIFLVSGQVAAQNIAYPDRHTTTLEDSWKSCSATANPNPARAASHWIKYDLGETYALQQSTLWNLNSPGNTTSGMKDMLIDYSIDGVVWREWGRHYLPVANASSFYQGANGPDFNGLIARYILITGVTNHGGPCYGLSEIRINGSPATTNYTDNLLENVSLTTSPNPFSNVLKVELSNLPEGDVYYQLTNIEGKVLRKGMVEDLTFTIDGNTLPATSYSFSLIHASGIKTVSVIKIN